MIFTCPFIQFILYKINYSMWRYWVYFLLAQSFIISDCISQIELGKVCIWYGFTYLFFSPALFIFNQCRKQCDDKCVCIAILYQVYQRCFLKHKGNGKQLGPIQLRWDNETILRYSREYLGYKWNPIFIFQRLSDSLR